MDAKLRYPSLPHKVHGAYNLSSNDGTLIVEALYVANSAAFT